MTLLLDTLYFSPTDPIKHRAIKVSLFGQSLVWLRADANTSTSSTNYESWRDKAPLFEIAANVLPFFHSNASTLQPGDTYSNFVFLLARATLVSASTRKMLTSVGRYHPICFYILSCIPAGMIRTAAMMWTTRKSSTV
jgi:hypothetical protein